MYKIRGLKTGVVRFYMESEASSRGFHARVSLCFHFIANLLVSLHLLAEDAPSEVLAVPPGVAAYVYFFALKKLYMIDQSQCPRQASKVQLV